MVEDQQSKPIAVSVPGDMKAWLDEHSRINRSKVFQNAVYQLMYPKPVRIPAQIKIICAMGIIVGLAMTLSFAGLIPTFAIWAIYNPSLMYVAYIMIMLGMSLAAISFLTLIKVKKGAIQTSVQIT